MSQEILREWKRWQMQPENYYAMPPVGMTESRTRIGKELRTQFTVRCGSDQCWFVGHGATKGDAQIVLDEHKCPTPPYRNELVTGRSTIQKVWDELDAVIDALAEQTSYNELDGEQLKGYARGIAFTLSMMSHPYFRTVSDIAKEAKERRKMRTGAIDFRDTPGYKYNPMPTERTYGAVKTEPAEKRTPSVRKGVAKKPTPLPAGTVNKIKAAHGSGMFTDPQDLALMCGVTVEQVKAVIGGT